VNTHPTFAQLRAMSDKELAARLDTIATSTQAGTQFYLDELRRRETDRQTTTMIELTKSIRWLTRVIVWLTVVVTLLTAVSVVVVLQGG
jgi:hypothetical protein